MDSNDLISEPYRRLNARLHATAEYGRHGDKWAPKIRELIAAHDIGSILDYGCGQGALGRALGIRIDEYDPAIPGKDSLPLPADLVVCTDVLEHIEPDRLVNVLDHLQSLTRRLFFAVVATRRARKFLEDGRNAHLIVQPGDSWRPMLEARFEIVEWRDVVKEFVALLVPMGGRR